MKIFDSGYCVPFLVEEEAYEGVKRIAGKVAGDMKLVSGIKPEILSHIDDDVRELILFATIGKSRILDLLIENGSIQREAVEGKQIGRAHV